MVGSPGSPTATASPTQSRPMSVMIRPKRSSSRLSISSRAGGSRASDEDGKTSVKVAVRVRPPLSPSDPGFELIPQRFQKGMVHVTSPTSLAVDSPQGRKIFVFDRVFGQEVNQDGIWEYLEESVNAFVQGYNVSVLAYGQSGAGKSYTMGTSGPNEQNDPKVMGVIPRAAVALFDKLGGPSCNRNGSSGLRAPVRYSTASISAAKQSASKEWTMKASYVEIYNEQLRDLLLPEGAGTAAEDRVPITIREDTKGRILLTGLHQVTINTVEDLLGVLNFGSSIRQTDATAINAKSSRSHAVFSLNLVQRKLKLPSPPDKNGEKRFSAPIDMMGQEGHITVDSKMHFVDLAGSERLKNTHAQGERAKEGISINAGLASLGKVISQLSSRQAGSHVSYRDSKLTRLLQDSLGGNAITYMIACVTPAEFHLSETLNTIQYAQRARAIQSKPRIQQVSDDGDMKALVERLRAEIAFLREQVKNANSQETNDRTSKGNQARSERSNEKEMELQNQLLDIQENYSALSQRHAKLISEITRARGVDEPPTSTEYTDSAVERLKRSNSFAEAVEQVVLEYEKTIQSLESSLSSTRSSLSSSESSLLEKETKLAYIETVNQQLQARLQKMMDRESSTETYLHDLEVKLDGHTSGEEKNAAIIAELRKEIARVRENEAGCEDYISTLEERLAEADQDMELMQREIDRLEHVVDRQRSLGKLDNLLYELDSIKQEDQDEKNGNGEKADESSLNGGRENTIAEGDEENETILSRTSSSSAKREGSLGTEGSNSQVQSRSTTPEMTKPGSEKMAKTGSSHGRETPTITLSDTSKHSSRDLEYPPQSPAQTQFVADKLENMQQELFDLKVEHEATVNEYDQMSANYEAALRDLAVLQDQLDEVRHTKGPRSRSASPSPSPNLRPTSFLADARVNILKEAEGQDSSSRSLSSELSLAGDLLSSSDTNDIESVNIKEELEAQRKSSQEKQTELMMELEKVKRENEKALRAQEDEQHRLHLQLRHSLDQLAEIRSKERNSAIISPSTSQLLRRKSNQNLVALDRAHRSFTNLRRIAVEHLVDQPDILENFELNMDGAYRELENRSHRIQDLENEILNLRKEMEAKSQLITGLTRERTSISSSPVDISVVAVMERRIEESEAEIFRIREVLASRETELSKANAALEIRSEETTSDAVALLEELTKERTMNAEQAEKISELQREIEQIKSTNDAAFVSLKESKEALSKTLSDLEVELNKTQGDSASEERALKDAAEDERIAHQKRVEALQSIVNQHKATIDSQLSRVADLERTHSETQGHIDRQLEAKTGDSGISDEDLQKQRDLAASLEQTISQNRETIESQQARLSTLEESYKDALNRLAELREKEIAAITALKEAESGTGNTLHEKLLADLEETQGAVQLHMANLTKLQTTHSEATALIEKLEQEKAAALVETAKQSEHAAALEKEVAESQETIRKHVATLKELQDLHDQSQADIKTLTEKEAAHSKLLEDLEQQLTFTFDQSQESSKRLGDMAAEKERLQVEKESLVAESAAKNAETQLLVENLNEEITALKTRLEEVQMELQGLGGGRTQRSNSISSNNNLRKSASTASLPSPPPAIPLPPLPNAAAGAPASAPAAAPAMSRRPSKDYVVTHIEDQEARIKTLEKQLQAEKALTATLEEALTDCEKTMKHLTTDRDSFQAKASIVQQELDRAKNESQSSRYSMQAVEEERLARLKAEQAREQLEQRMQALSKKNKRSFACF